MTLTLRQIVQDILDSLVVDQTNDLYMCTALAGEIGEYCNFIKKENRTNGYRFKFKQDTEDESVDVLYYAVAIAVCRTNSTDVDVITNEIERIWNRKMNHNERKYKRVVKQRPVICDCDDCKSGDYGVR